MIRTLTFWAAGSLLALVWLNPSAIAHAAYENCTSNPSVCASGATCRSVPKWAVDGSGTDTTPVGICLTDTQYTVIQQGIAAKSSTIGNGNTDTPSPIGTGNTDSGTGATIANPLKVQSLQQLLGILLDAAIQIGSIILTIALIWCGFLFVAARGNEEKISRARSALVWTIIGGLILLGAKGIQTVITSTVSGLTS